LETFESERAFLTSFNDREHIVETPAHALATLQACDLDAARIGLAA
jgi:hypothetical protein